MFFSLFHGKPVSIHPIPQVFSSTYISFRVLLTLTFWISRQLDFTFCYVTEKSFLNRYHYIYKCQCWMGRDWTKEKWSMYFFLVFLQSICFYCVSLSSLYCTSWGTHTQAVNSFDYLHSLIILSFSLFISPVTKCFIFSSFYCDSRRHLGVSSFVKFYVVVQ